MYVIVNPTTLALHGGVFKTLKAAKAAYELSLETYGITTDYRVYYLSGRSLKGA